MEQGFSGRSVDVCGDVFPSEVFKIVVFRNHSSRSQSLGLVERVVVDFEYFTSRESSISYIPYCLMICERGRYITVSFPLPSIDDSELYASFSY